MAELASGHLAVRALRRAGVEHLSRSPAATSADRRVRRRGAGEADPAPSGRGTDSRSLQPGLRYDGVARALDGAGETVSTPGALRRALQRAFDAGVPYLANVLTDPKVAYRGPPPSPKRLK